MSQAGKFKIFIGLLVASCCIALPVGTAGQSLHQPTPSEKRSLERFLRKFGSPQHSAAFVDLGEDGHFEVIAQLSDAEWCGTGGCRTLILAPEGSSYRVVNNFLIARPPIRVLATKSHGWHDISVCVPGGGIQPGYESRLSFNGKLYPVSTSLLEAGKIKREAPGLVVISGE